MTHARKTVLGQNARDACLHARIYLVCMILTALVTGVYCEEYRESVAIAKGGTASGLLAGNISVMALGYVFAFSLVAFATLRILFDKRVFSFLVRWRFPIAVALLCLCVALKISGSSVAYWGNITGDNTGQGTLLGISRPIRSDEWDVMTPFAFSQVNSGFHAVSPALGGGGTDVTMVYGQPALSAATLFRPFLWGYFFLGAERGLSFFWCGRILCMILVGFSFFRLLSKDDALCMLGSLLCAFSPAVQWWFAVNGTAELLIFGEGLVLTLKALLEADSQKSRWGWTLLLAWMCFCYLLILYPAWQVPFFWIFLALGVWVVLDWRNRNESSERRIRVHANVIPLLVSFAAFGFLFAFAVYTSKATIIAVMGSVYPGSRSETGGGLAKLLPNLALSIAGPINDASITPNVCDAATYLVLAPLGAILGIYYGCIRQRDACTICLLVPYAVLLAYGLFGFPEPVCKILLLSNLPTYRIPQALGFLDTALLVRGVAQGIEWRRRCQSTNIRSDRVKRFAVCVLPSCILAIAYVLVGRLWNPQAMRYSLCFVSFGATFFATAALIRLSMGCEISDSASKSLAQHFSTKTEGVKDTPCRSEAGRFALVLAAPLLLAGVFVNPVQVGAQALLNNTPANLAKEVTVSHGPGTWITESCPISQDLIAQGLPSLNSVNTYPRLSVWEKVDPEGRYADIYNRYAHIEVRPAATTSFELIQSDLIIANLTADDLRALGIRYWLATDDVSASDTASTHLQEIAEQAGYTVWEVIPTN